MILLIQIFFWVLNIAVGKYQAYRFDKQQKRINHTVWLLYYATVALNAWWLCRSWLVVAALLVLHLPLFNTALNYFRTPRRALFYTHPEDPQGSVIDRVWGDVYPAVFFLTCITYVVLQFYIYE
jgi:hypothetical protein